MHPVRQPGSLHILLEREPNPLPTSPASLDRALQGNHRVARTMSIQQVKKTANFAGLVPRAFRSTT
jgi:hypothetical protein